MSSTLFTNVPVGYYHTQMNPDYDWCYHTENIPGLGGRSLQYPRGKALGGSSSVNGMLWVRGQSNDYDEWSKELNDNNWSGKSCLPRFQELEKILRVGPSRCNMSTTDQGIRAFVEASKEL